MFVTSCNFILHQTLPNTQWIFETNEEKNPRKIKKLKKKHIGAENKMRENHNDVSLLFIVSFCFVVLLPVIFLEISSRQQYTS